MSDKGKMIIAGIYFVLNIAIIITSSIILAQWGMGFKHSIMYAVMFSSIYDIFPIVRGFFKGLTGRLK